MDTLEGNPNEYNDILDHNVLVIEAPWSNIFHSLVWKNLTGLQRTLTSASSDTFGVDWNTHADLIDTQTPSLPSGHYPTSLLDFTDALLADWEPIPAARLQPEKWRKIEAHVFGMTCNSHLWVCVSSDSFSRQPLPLPPVGLTLPDWGGFRSVSEAWQERKNLKLLRESEVFEVKRARVRTAG